jgi:rubrerythrin
MHETLKNLTKAFIGESQARNRYTIYAKVAKKEGYEQIAGIFAETAEQEKEHAKRLWEHIQELKEKMDVKTDEITVEATAPTAYGSTKENLRAAAAGEHYEYEEMYPDFADVAEKEGLKVIAGRMRAIAVAEKHHEERYLKMLEEVENFTVYKKDKEVTWVCRECGYQYEGKQPPARCPSCDHERSYYQIKCERF